MIHLNCKGETSRWKTQASLPSQRVIQHWPSLKPQLGILYDAPPSTPSREGQRVLPPYLAAPEALSPAPANAAAAQGNPDPGRPCSAWPESCSLPTPAWWSGPWALLLSNPVSQAGIQDGPAHRTRTSRTLWCCCPLATHSPGSPAGCGTLATPPASLLKPKEQAPVSAIVCMLVAPSCLTLCDDPMDCSLPGSCVHGILQARILEWAAISFSRRSSKPRNWAQVFHIAGGFFTVWATREALTGITGTNTGTEQLQEANTCPFLCPPGPHIARISNLSQDASVKQGYTPPTLGRWDPLSTHPCSGCGCPWWSRSPRWTCGPSLSGSDSAAATAGCWPCPRATGRVALHGDSHDHRTRTAGRPHSPKPQTGVAQGLAWRRPWRGSAGNVNLGRGRQAT